ncbi:unnamed protein product [Pleuronectes platessa]|uniref:CCHC-type domain-containing protein n=1 Tax=Pleuronectes platessa TaxID=8262 RepID=A0A9N7YIS4_PLEPL|nr:unnamed protein product [Pleuronectes platessa]
MLVGAAEQCFGCGEEGHTVRACPRRSDPAPPGPDKATSAGAPAGLPAGPLAPERRDRPAPRGGRPGSGSPQRVPVAPVPEDQQGTRPSARSRIRTGQSRVTPLRTVCPSSPQPKHCYAALTSPPLLT